MTNAPFQKLPTDSITGSIQVTIDALTSLLDSITTVPSIGGLPNNATRRQISGSQLLSATVPVDQVVYTVPAGKTLYITDVLILYTGATAVVLTWLSGATTFLIHNIGSGIPVQLSGLSSFTSFAATTAIHITAPIAAAQTVYYNFYGYEV